MADSITIARPYAKAVFEHARAQKNLKEWSGYLQNLASIVMDANAAKFLTNPESTIPEHCELLLSGLTKTKAEPMSDVANFVQTLADNKRLLILPQILILFQEMREEEEKTVVVYVNAFQALSESLSKKLIESLSKRLQRQVTLQVSIDKALLGGAVIRANDLVIDGSVRGKINKLRAALAA